MKIGNRVAVLDDAISGVVQAIHSQKIVVMTDDGFEMEFSKAELVLIPSSSNDSIMSTTVSSHVIRSKDSDKKPIRAKKLIKKELPPLVVDLHIHKLVKDSRGMSNYDMLSIQVDTIKRQISFAIRKKIQCIVFIHGVGQGVLKEELRYTLRQYDDLRYYDADYKVFGAGATEVYLEQRAFISN